MDSLTTLRKHLKAGKVYRRADLLQYTTAPDRHLAALISDGSLTKVSQGIYYVPRATDFGVPPPDDKTLVKSFLKDNRFLILSPNMYNMLGIGITQLYNDRVVYNHKRHGLFELGGLKFRFHRKQFFPSILTKEFLLVDLVSNLKSLAEDENALLQNVQRKAAEMNAGKLGKVVDRYGSIKARKFFAPLLKKPSSNG
ncbi:MAG: hypothetical protein KG029_06270 [Bacteroidetes bacterium]|nr:hypothetical protein [Bacteroidota bacterium]